MEVKLVARTLDVFEVFARDPRPLSLTELSRTLEAPPSSMLALIRTLIQRGYLYETRRKGGYYPTKKLYAASMKIDAGDPVLEFVRPHLAKLRERAGETVVLGKRIDLRIVYLEVVPCDKAIRYIVDPGDTRTLYPNSMGRAIFASLEPAEQAVLAPRVRWVAKGAKRAMTDKELMLDAALTLKRGWAANLGESDPDMAALAVPFAIGDEWFAMAIAGPLGRMQASWDANVRVIRQTARELAATLRTEIGQE